MSSAQNNHDRIADLVAAYGGDLKRWPAKERHRVDALDPLERKQLLGEARALDRLLSSASSEADGVGPSDALMDRILSSLPIEQTETPSVGPATPAALNRNLDHQVSTQHRALSDTWRPRIRESIAAASLLAASLVVGFFVGSSDLGRTATVQLGDLAGLSDEFTGMQTTALDDALQIHDDEDIL